MSNVNAGISYGSFSNPAGTAVSKILVRLVGTGSNMYSQLLDPGTGTAVFSSVTPDTYTLTVQAQDATAAPIGPAVSQSGIIVSAPTVQPLTVQIPTSVSVTVQ